MQNVVDLKGRLEQWKAVFSDKDSCLYVSISNHGRISLRTSRDTVTLDLVSSSNLISSIQNGIDSLFEVQKSNQ